jgi:hypothetical protein
MSAHLPSYSGFKFAASRIRKAPSFRCLLPSTEPPMPTIRYRPSGDQATLRAVQSITALRSSLRARTDQMRMVRSSPTVANTSGSVGCVARPHSSPS